jgi:hypothetical protein
MKRSLLRLLRGKKSLLCVYLSCLVLFGCGRLSDRGNMPPMPGAAALQLAWEVPTTNTDGTPLTDLAGYKIHYGTAPGSYTTTIDVGNQTTYHLTGLPGGHTYYMVVTAYDTSGNESTFSTEVHATLPPTSRTSPN